MYDSMMRNMRSRSVFSYSMYILHIVYEFLWNAIFHFTFFRFFVLFFSHIPILLYLCCPVAYHDDIYIVFKMLQKSSISLSLSLSFTHRIVSGSISWMHEEGWKMLLLLMFIFFYQFHIRGMLIFQSNLNPFSICFTWFIAIIFFFLFFYTQNFFYAFFSQFYYFSLEMLLAFDPSADAVVN